MKDKNTKPQEHILHESQELMTIIKLIENNTDDWEDERLKMGLLVGTWCLINAAIMLEGDNIEKLTLAEQAKQLLDDITESGNLSIELAEEDERMIPALKRLYDGCAVIIREKHIKKSDGKEH